MKTTITKTLNKCNNLYNKKILYGHVTVIKDCPSKGYAIHFGSHLGSHLEFLERLNDAKSNEIVCDKH